MTLDALRSRFPLFTTDRCYAPPDGAGGGGGGADDGAESQIDGADGDDGKDPDDPTYDLEDDDVPAGEGRPDGTPPARTERAAAKDEGGARTPEDESSARLATLEKELREERELRLYYRGLAEGRGRPREERRQEPEPVALSDEEKAVKEEMLKLFPNIALLDRLSKELFGEDETVYKNLISMGKSAPALARQQQEHWDGVADRACTAALSEVAKLYSADPAKPTKLKDEVAEDVEETFIRWVGNKKAPERIKRYERQDPTLAADFAKYWEANYVAPHRRQDDAAEHARDVRRRRLPNGGQGGGPQGQPRRKTDPMDEDAVFDGAWKALQEARQS
jgi:hypothetical protein